MKIVLNEEVKAAVNKVNGDSEVERRERERLYQHSSSHIYSCISMIISGHMCICT